MAVFLTILMLVFVLMAAMHFWLGHGEDLSVYDHPVEGGAGESFSNSAGPSTGHQGAVAAIEAMRPEIESLSVGGMIRFVRRFMEEIPAGKQLTAALFRLKMARFVENGCWRRVRTRPAGCCICTVAHFLREARTAIAP